MKKNNLGTGLSLTLAFITGVLGTYLVFMNNPKITKNIVENINKVEISENSIADSVDKVYDAVLAIVSYKNDTQIASGTGFVYYRYVPLWKTWQLCSKCRSGLMAGIAKL